MPNDHWLPDAAREKAEELYQQARRCEAETQLRQQEGLLEDVNGPGWSEVARCYQEVIKFLDEAGREHVRSSLDDETKLLCARSLIGFYHARLQNMRDADPGILQYDDPHRVNRHVKALEREIKSYRIERRAVWNVLQYTYDRWGEERRNDGLKNEADELQYHMLQARMKFRLWSLFPRAAATWSKLSEARSDLAVRVEKRLPRQVKGGWRWIGQLTEALRASLEWSLFLVGKGLVWPFLVFVIIPILACAVVYNQNGWVCQLQNGGPVELQGPMRFWYSLYFSIFVFTGSEPGEVTACLIPDGQPGMATLMAGEAIFAYVFMLVVIGYLVNRLSSR